MAARFKWIEWNDEMVRAIIARDREEAEKFLVEQLWVPLEWNDADFERPVYLVLCRSIKNTWRNRTFVVILTH